MRSHRTYTRREDGDTIVYAVPSAKAGWKQAVWTFLILVVVGPIAYTTFAPDPFDNVLYLMLMQGIVLVLIVVCIVAMRQLNKRYPSRTWTIDRAQGIVRVQGSETAIGPDASVTVSGSPPVLSVGSTVLLTGTTDADHDVLQQIADALRTDIRATKPHTNV